MPLEEVQARLRIALTTTIVEEYSLFAATSPRMPPSERAFATQMAFRLRNTFENHWDVDVEYNSRPTLGEQRQRSPVLQLPTTPELIIHRRGRRGPDHNLLLLGLKIQDTPNFEQEVHRLACLMSAYEYRYAAILNLNLAYAAADGEPPAVLLPTWYWIDTEANDAELYAHNAALEICRRGHDQSALRTQSGKPSQGMIFQSGEHAAIAAEEERRVEILPQLHVRYGDWIRGDVTSAALVQLADAVLLEMVRNHQKVERVDLDVMGDDFKPTDAIGLNVAKFLSLGEWTLINVTNLFEEEAAEAIAMSGLIEE
jgi:hypothetical protein